MSRILALSLFFVSLEIYAQTSGAVLINSDNSEAKIVINEAMLDGDLSKLFDQLNIVSSSAGSTSTKQFTLSNGRFGFSCRKGTHSHTPPSTSCTFVIKSGSNTNDINTFILKAGNEKVATLGVTSTFSSELERVFGNLDYSFKVPGGVISEFKIVGWGNSIIGFSSL